MTKDQYQNLDCVKNFSSWMSSHLDDDTFSHQYTNIKNRKEWSCSSLYSAYTQYQWGNSNFAENNNTLLNLRENLENAITNHDPESLYKAAIEVMNWGGVMQGNAAWLSNNKETLLQVIEETRDALNAGDQNSPVLNNADLRFNAGMTKVYSLICNNFIIYDSRVAAALGWAVTKFCQSQNLQGVPAELRFPWSAARGAQRRNPCINDLIFPRLQSGSIHARWNLKASWLLEAVIHHHNAKFSKFLKFLPEDNILRALESALFMIGYDLN